MATKKANTVALLVTTSHKGVFFGYGEPTAGNEIVLKDARMCVYWSSELRGVLGLASTGPTKNCKVGPKVHSIKLFNVTAVVGVSDEAAANWEKSPWA